MEASARPLKTAVFSRVSALFGLDTTVTLYDLTNTYFEGDAAIKPPSPSGGIPRSSAVIVPWSP